MRVFLVLVFLLEIVAGQMTKPGSSKAPAKPISWKVGMSKAEQSQVVKSNMAVFKWSGMHNVYRFPDKKAFVSCDFSKATLLSSKSPFTFKAPSSGTYYFGCRVGAHCKAGQKLALTVAASGKQPKKVCSKCPKTDDPVCGKDMVTYPNDCQAICNWDDATPFHKGECTEPKPKDCKKKCARSKKMPVCSANLVTYDNICTASCEGASMYPWFGGHYKSGACKDCSKILCPKSLCPDGSKRTRIEDKCCACRKNPVCPAARTILKKIGFWSAKSTWMNNYVPTKVDVALVPNTKAKFALIAGKGDVALDIRIQNKNIDLVIGRGKTGQLVVGPDPKGSLCSGTKKCKLDKTKLKKGFVGTYYGSSESMDSKGKIISKTHRGVQIGCKKDWQRVKGDDKKLYSCGMVNDLLDGFKPDTQCNEDKCPKTCQGKTCETWIKLERYTCKELEEEYGCNCWGCHCRNLDEECKEDVCLGKTCDAWSTDGYGCAQLEKNFKCGCKGCKCKHDHNPKPPTNIKMLLGLSNIGGGNGKVTKDIGAPGFNDAFHKGTGIIYRHCPKCDPSHQHIYYRRFGAYWKYDPYMLVACAWNDKNNVMGKDFKLYSSYADAVAGKPNVAGSKTSSDVGSWKYCNYLNFKGAKPNAMGAFRDCGPNKVTGGQWSVMVGAGEGKCNKGYHAGMQAEFFIIGVSTYDKCLGVKCAAAHTCASAGKCKPANGECAVEVRNVGQKCDDKNTNTHTDKCTPKGQCVGIPKVDLCKATKTRKKVVCKAKGQCHQAGVCNKATGKCSDPLKKKGTKCNDKIAKTVEDQCDGKKGLCAGVDKCAKVTCFPKDDCHKKGVCNKFTGKCSHPMKKKGTKCNDKSAKTVNDRCDEKGVCKGKNLCLKVKCAKKTQCHKVGVCDYKTGKCSDPVNTGGKCDDKIKNTVEDKCDAKAVCKGVDKCKSVKCKPKNQCHKIGVCNINTGVCSNPFENKGLKCDDKSSKTGDDRCNGAGTCQGRNLCIVSGKAKYCSAETQCHVKGICMTGTGKCTKPFQKVGVKCDDKNKNTVNDACNGKGLCTGKALKDLCKGKPACSTANKCRTAGKCNPGTGKCINPAKPEKSKCDDKNVNTGDDQCDGYGKCEGRDLCVGVKCIPSKDQCFKAGCNSGLGKCYLAQQPKDFKCDDKNKVTVNDKCQKIKKLYTCAGDDLCKKVVCKYKECYAKPTCNYLSGKCGKIGAVLKDGSPCFDGDPNTEKDSCTKGVCKGIKVPTCLIITGIFDGPIKGGPKGVEIYSFCDIKDLSTYGMGSANNGKGTDGQEFIFSKMPLKKGTFFYVTNDKESFAKYFRFPAEYEFKKIGLSGNDAVELFMTVSNQLKVVDTFGDPNTDGWKTKWEYTKGYVYRKDQTGPEGAKFDMKKWINGGKNALKGTPVNGGAKRYGGAFPVATYCRKLPCIRLTTTTTTTTSTTTTGRDTTTSTTTTTTSTTTLGGCTKKTACNYNAKAQGDDGSCKYPLKCQDCKKKCICKTDECGVCGGKGAGSDMKKCATLKGVQVNWIKDKTCDDVHNNCHCGWDGGDCCGEGNDKKYCKICKCQDPNFKVVEKKGDCGKCSGKCAKPAYKGDKYCDDTNNNCACQWDGGDCCGGNNNYNYCKKCKCLDCKFKHKGDKCTKQIKGKCANEKWKSDKNCDDDNNNAGCQWDGGDCCGSNNYGYCKKCKCRDCTYVAKGDKCVKAMKGACGAKNYAGDKFCDDNNNNAGCAWDKGDCCGPKNNYQYCKLCKCRDCTVVTKGDTCVKVIKKTCGSPKWKGDGNCDDNNNNAGCTWDGGDCCGSKNYAYCKACKCLDCTYVSKGDTCVKDFKKGCGGPKFKGDGYCDDNNNWGGCSWDGGDCCGDKANVKYCKLCECRDCTKKKPKNCKGKAKGCGLAQFKKDKNCDDENNNCRCDWDGGDCCGKSNGGSVNKKYCKICKCLDPANKGDPNCKGSCGAAAYKKDGNCDDANNNCGCGYDGGDCCSKTLGGKAVSKKYCKECKCLDPKAQGSSTCTGSCGAAAYKKDGNCDDANNNCGCDYDGGDCCSKTLGGKAVSKKYCKLCKCLDPKGQGAITCKGACGDVKYKKDGNCDDSNNNCGCEFDGGDCCAKTLGKAVSKKYCKACACLDPKGK